MSKKLEIKYIPVDDIKGMEDNPRKISDFDFQNLKKSLGEFGTVQPVIVNNDYTLIGGHQRFKALKEIGIKEVPAIVLDLSKEKAKALNLSLNRISGEWDYALLDKFLKDIDDEAILGLSGFTTQELSQFKVKMDFDQLNKELSNLEEQKKEELDWKAKVDMKEFERVKDLIEDVKKNIGIGKYYSDYANGQVLIKLVEEVLSRFKAHSQASGYFEDYEGNSLRSNGKILIELAEQHLKLPELNSEQLSESSKKEDI